jgi:hypothetical protein
MGYRGTEWFLCERGHLSKEDALVLLYVGGSLSQACPHCGGHQKLMFSQDTTNGSYVNEPSSMPPYLDEVGFHDVPKVDHRGNHYVEKLAQYVPQEGGAQHWVSLIP